MSAIMSGYMSQDEQTRLFDKAEKQRGMKSHWLDGLDDFSRGQLFIGAGKACLWCNGYGSVYETRGSAEAGDYVWVQIIPCVCRL